MKATKLINGLEPCEKHKRYTGKRRPRVACEQCWRIYFESEKAAWDF
jgi:hypothetical protein